MKQKHTMKANKRESEFFLIEPEIDFDVVRLF